MWRVFVSNFVSDDKKENSVFADFFVCFIEARCFGYLFEKEVGVTVGKHRTENCEIVKLVFGAICFLVRYGRLWRTNHFLAISFSHD